MKSVIVSIPAVKRATTLESVYHLRHRVTPAGMAQFGRGRQGVAWRA